MPRTPLVIAHRGARGLVPFENTLHAFERAVELGADMVEFDVHQTADGQLAIFHDDRLPDGRAVADLPLADLQAWALTQGFALPELGATIDALAGRIGLDVEIKGVGYEAAVLEALVTRLPYDAFVVKSFHDRSVLQLKLLDPRARAGLLLGDDDPANPLQTRRSELFPRARLRACRADFVAPYHQLVRLGYTWRMARLGMPVYTWTVNDPVDMQRLLRLGVDALITDRPDVALALLGRRRA